MLLLLQNRGRMTSHQLATALEVSTRTILRDVDAMTEAGLPIIVFQGNQGGIELGFNYRTRLTGLDQEEAESLGVVLSTQNPAIAALGMQRAFSRARSKLIESFPDKVRATTERAGAQFPVTFEMSPKPDERVAAFALAVREKRIVRVNVNTDQAKTLHPIALTYDGRAWVVTDQLSDAMIAVQTCGDINISAHRFDGAVGD
ncbi:helix-turn-helix transcriptional regulator [Cognatiyoonia sp. IB215182]|uniref:helix-turn-helix transcriptional regulator n=1 Tax=Cognatiyoonia sp. IB215182 TaxID=3097353 RepID=UPI002A1748D8|nr:HTH domain-containing protein [Cognatiyoonia sp. IB215182]MDX8351667.1 HTH domain-containing protein [Cognatiyoonia sp. IB215182]